MSDRTIPGQQLDRRLFVLGLGVSLLAGCAGGGSDRSRTVDTTGSAQSPSDTSTVPGKRETGGLLDAIERRRSIRSYTDASVSEQDVALMAWAAQGITDVDRGLRAAPSALAAYPLRLYVATAKSLRLYQPEQGAFKLVRAEDVRPGLLESSGQPAVGKAPVVFVVTGRYGVLEQDLGEKAQRCVHLEAGHATQNLVLTATSLGLAGVTAGSFEDSMVREVLGASVEETPLYLVPIGHPA